MKFKIKCLLAKHTLVHLTQKPKEDKVNFCHICEKEFSSRSNTRIHMRFVHNKETLKRKKCTECEYTTPKKKSLEQHIKSM